MVSYRANTIGDLKALRFPTSYWVSSLNCVKTSRRQCLRFLLLVLAVTTIFIAMLTTQYAIWLILPKTLYISNHNNLLSFVTSYSGCQKMEIFVVA